MSKLNKIPKLTLASDVSDVKVSENGEELVLLSDEQTQSLVIFSKAFKDGKVGSISEVLVRESVKDLLVQASNHLPEGYRLVVWETYTPKALQESIRGKKLDDISGFSHMTGGAVDVSLADTNGNLLNMGTDLNHGSPENKTTLYFEELEESGASLSDQEQEIRDHRRILFHAMNKAGFVNSPLAWFHWDYGNLWWAKVKGEDAFYGSLDK